MGNMLVMTLRRRVLDAAVVRLPRMAMLLLLRASISLNKGSLLSIARLVSIVDDDEAVRLAMDTLVRSFGNETRLFACAEEFFASGLIAETACLISDIMMPGMSGVEMVERLRQLEYALPTLLMTSFPAEELTAKAIANGALVVLNKPVDPETLSYWLAVALGSPH